MGNLVIDVFQLGRFCTTISEFMKFYLDGCIFP